MLKRSVSLWLLAAAAGLFVLQAIPIVGFLPSFLLALVSLDAGVVNALLVHAFLASLFIEAAVGRLPRWLMIVPVVAYGAYYGAYFEQDRMVAEESAKLRTINLGKVLDFDPSAMSLVLDKSMSKGLDTFVALHRIPVAYSQRISARLVPASQCSTMKNYRNGASAWVRRVPIYDYHLFTNETQPCWLTRIEQPVNRPVVVQSTDHASRLQLWLGINEPSTDIVVDSRIVGSFQEIRVRRIPPYLWFVGCGLVDEPAGWVCGGLYTGKDERIQWDPPSVDKMQFDTPTSILLGVPKYTNSDLLNFSGYPSNAAVVALAQIPMSQPLP